MPSLWKKWSRSVVRILHPDLFHAGRHTVGGGGWSVLKAREVNQRFLKDFNVCSSLMRGTSHLFFQLFLMYLPLVILLAHFTTQIINKKIISCHGVVYPMFLYFFNGQR
jgi:hypothetical protein